MTRFDHGGSHPIEAIEPVNSHSAARTTTVGRIAAGTTRANRRRQKPGTSIRPVL
jgi:hypothetical protein